MSPISRSRKRSDRHSGILILLFGIVVCAAVRAAGRPDPATGDARVLVYRNRPDRIYTVRTLAGAVTDIALAPGEHPLTFVLGDTVRWVVAHDPSDVFVKPVRVGLFTSATLITNEHRYELLLESVPRGVPWDEEVRWRTPRPLVLLRRPFHRPRPRATPIGRPTTPRVDTRFVIRGRARWRPREVYALGRRTYFVFRRHAATLPVLFLVRHGRAVLANYAVAGRTIVYPGLFRRAVLVLGRRRVRVRRLP
jgi:type IV secretory pathway VirB9-like protein